MSNSIQLYEEALVDGDHHFPATYVIIKSVASGEWKTADADESSGHVLCVEFCGNFTDYNKKDRVQHGTLNYSCTFFFTTYTTLEVLF